MVPYVVFVSVPFFFLKYIVDKYNMTFAYNSEFLGIGNIKKLMIPLTLFNVLVSQAVCMALLAGKMENHEKSITYFTMGGIIILIEIILLFIYRCRKRAASWSEAKKLKTINGIVSGEYLKKASNLTGIEKLRQRISGPDDHEERTYLPPLPSQQIIRGS